MSDSEITKPIYFDSHMHTPLCKHAMGEPEEYAEQGRARGLKILLAEMARRFPWVEYFFMLRAWVDLRSPPYKRLGQI